MVVCLTCTEQRGTSISDAVKREIGQGLVEGHGVDKGIAVADTRTKVCAFFDFETCEEIKLFSSNVRLPSLHDVARRAEKDNARAGVRTRICGERW